MNWSEFFLISVAHFFAVISPGPDFALVVRVSLRFGSSAGVWTSLGIGCGILLHVSYCLLGVAVLVSQSDLFLVVLKVLAACYLSYLGVRILASWRQSSYQNLTIALEKGGEPTIFRAWLDGFLTNGLNPKATLFFLALFSLVIDSSTPLALQAGYGLYLSAATIGWFVLLANAIGHDSVRGKLAPVAPYIDLAMGIVLLFLALGIALDV